MGTLKTSLYHLSIPARRLPKRALPGYRALCYDAHIPLIHLQGGTIVTADGMRREDLFVKDGMIERKEEARKNAAPTVIDCTDKYIFPGLIDCHVHFRDPGFPHKATMRSEAEAAIAGGVTTVCEMPNTSPPTVTVAALADKIRRADTVQEQVPLDMRFFFGITEAIHLAAFLELMDSSAEESIRLRRRLAGIKLYLDHSTGNQKVEGGIVDDIFRACAAHDTVLVAHCEDSTMNANAAAQNTRTDIAAHSLIRPAESEVESITGAIERARTHGTRLHIAHLSTDRGLECVSQAKKDGLPVTCEVAPHHLFFTTDDYEHFGTLIKMNPPVRSREHVEALWEGISSGTVDCISTDHAPHTLAEKKNAEPLKAPSGVPGVETMLPLLLSVAAGHWPHHRSSHTLLHFSYPDIVRLCFSNPNRIFGLGKQSLTPGQNPDIVIIDPATEWEIQGDHLHSLCKWTPYEGWKVKGKVERVMSGSA